MTDDIKNGIDNGVESVDGGNGVETKDGVKETANDSNVDELAKLKAELAKRDATISKFAEEKKQREHDAEQARLANLSTEEKLKELEAQIQADKEEKALINAATAKGLNPSQARELAQKVKGGDFDGMANLMAAMLEDVKTSTSKQVEETIKSSIKTSTAPATNETTVDPMIASFKKGAGLN